MEINRRVDYRFSRIIGLSWIKIHLYHKQPDNKISYLDFQKKNWDLCEQCDKPLSNEANIKILRIIIAGSGLVGIILGGIALQCLGFGLGGITAGSLAASIQGPAVVAGSLFAVLQSLGATGMGILLFGSIGASVGVLAPIAAKLEWA